MFSQPASRTIATQAPSNTGFRWLIFAGLFFASDLATWHWSLDFTTVANSTILVNCAPIFVTIGAWIFFRQRVTMTFMTGLVIALVGAIMLVGASFELSRQNMVGDGIAIITAMFYAGYILSVKQARQSFSTVTIMGWSGIVSSLVLLPITILSGESLLATTLAGWLVLLGLAMAGQVVGQGLIAYALAHLPAPFSSVTLLLQPTLATLFAWLILNEAITISQAIGGTVVLSGILIARQGSEI
jgi:drug/metabolite transporter (DMT)-like permease